MIVEGYEYREVGIGRLEVIDRDLRAFNTSIYYNGDIIYL